MRFWNCDQHISVIGDIKKIFTELGHTVEDKCLSGHAWVMGRKTDSIPMLDGDKWGGFVGRKDWDKFSDLYGKELEQYDAFIVTFPPIFAYLYKNFDKPIIIDIPIRYEYPCQSDAKDWEDFNDYLVKGVDRKKIFLVANNLYDTKYAECFLERPVEYIPSLCEYTNVKYAPCYDAFIYYAAKPYNEFNNTKFHWKHHALKAGHTWQQLYNFRAILHFPYNVSTMSTFEQYAANVPMFCPTIDLLMKLYSRGKVYRIMEQTSWTATFGRPSGSIIKKPFPSGYDPNDYLDHEAVRYWMQFSDYYSGAFKEMTYFDSFGELNLLDKMNLTNISQRMSLDNIERKKSIYDKWKNLLEKIKCV